MFCKRCGKEVEKPGKYCEFCGKETGAEIKKEKQNNTENWLKFTIGKLKSVSKKQKILIISGIAFILIAFGFYQIGSNSSKPDNVATKYFSELSQANYGKAYEYLSLPENELTTKDTFISLMQKRYGTSPWVMSYKLNNPENKKQDNSLSSLYSTDYSSNDGIKQTKLISYISKDNNQKGTEIVTLVKTNKKRLLFFDDWEVDGSNYLQSSWFITIPKGAVLFINDKEISKKNIKEDMMTSSFARQSGYSNQPQTETYKLKNVFPAEYNVKVTMKNAKDYIEKVNTQGSTIVLKPDDSTQKEIEEIIKKYNTSWEKAVNKRDINLVKDYITPNSSQWDKTQSFFQGIKDDKVLSETLKGIEFTEIYIDDSTHIRAEISETWESTRDSFLGGSLTQTNQSKNDYRLEKVNDKWLIYDCFNAF
ncbi:MAG: TcaA NTF2-like domain-containing protein [Ignavibacteriales bacterium]